MWLGALSGRGPLGWSSNVARSVTHATPELEIRVTVGARSGWEALPCSEAPLELGSGGAQSGGLVDHVDWGSVVPMSIWEIGRGQSDDRFVSSVACFGARPEDGTSSQVLCIFHGCRIDLLDHRVWGRR